MAQQCEQSLTEKKQKTLLNAYIKTPHNFINLSHCIVLKKGDCTIHLVYAILFADLHAPVTHRRLYHINNLMSSDRRTQHLRNTLPCCNRCRLQSRHRFLKQNLWRSGPSGKCITRGSLCESDLQSLIRQSNQLTQ